MRPSACVCVIYTYKKRVERDGLLSVGREEGSRRIGFISYIGGICGGCWRCEGCRCGVLCKTNVVWGFGSGAASAYNSPAVKKRDVYRFLGVSRRCNKRVSIYESRDEEIVGSQFLLGRQSSSRLSCAFNCSAATVCVFLLYTYIPPALTRALDSYFYLFPR